MPPALRDLLSPPITALTGFGRTRPSVPAELLRFGPDDRAELAAAAAGRTPRGAIARGLGRSYGDPAQNGGGTVLELHGDPRSPTPTIASDGTVTVFAGTSIDELLRAIVPQGWFVPVTPGTRFVTIGGAVASDIHGKNHHLEGSFGNHVSALTLLRSDGERVTIGPEQDAELFWATVGGMGLTGVIEDVTLRLLRIETSRCVVDVDRIADLDTLLVEMERGDRDHRYSVAWVDPLATGRHLGRSVLARGEHARRDQLDPADAIDPLAYSPRQLGSVPGLVPPHGVFNTFTVKVFNEVWYRRAPKHRLGEIQTIPTYFHPLDAVADWNRLYGRRGMVQYQFVVPLGAETALRAAMERFATAGAPSFLSVLKRFGSANPAPLSFPMPGWTLALDLPASSALLEVFADIDRIVMDAGGRHYLAKDAHVSAAAIRAGYPRLAEWQAIQRRVDPDGRWVSDQARRLGLVEHFERTS